MWIGGTQLRFPRVLTLRPEGMWFQILHTRLGRSLTVLAFRGKLTSESNADKVRHRRAFLHAMLAHNDTQSPQKRIV